MCTLGLLLGQHPDYPLIVAANRDESAARPALGPMLWPDPPMVAGRDEEAGGTWMGLNAAGIFVGLTNLWHGNFRKKQPRSRGALVVELLAAQSLEALAARVAATAVEGIGPFNLVCADTSGRAFTACSAEGLTLRWRERGIYAISNLPPDAPWAKTDRVVAGLTVARDSADLLAGLRATLAHHTLLRDPQSSTCVHTPTPYGTVSSTILLASPASGALHHAAGPPCTTPFVDRSALLAALQGLPAEGLAGGTRSPP